MGRHPILPVAEPGEHPRSAQTRHQPDDVRHREVGRLLRRNRHLLITTFVDQPDHQMVARLKAMLPADRRPLPGACR